MTDPSLNLRDLLSLPDPAAPAEPSNRWQEFQGHLGREIKGIKWPAAMPDLVSKIGELFDVPLPDLLAASWKKADALQGLLEESRKNPEKVMFLELAEHTVRSEYHPYIEIRIAGMPLPKKIEFAVRLSAGLKGIVLRIKGGAIAEIQMGHCEFEGKVRYANLTIAEKKVGPIQFQGLSTTGVPDAAPRV
jgi:hypothetical protein